MKIYRRWLPLLALSVLAAAGRTAELPTKNTVIEIFEGRRVAFALPEGFTLTHAETQGGGIAVHVTAAKGALDLQLVFLPDPEGEFVSSARARKEFMVQAFSEFVESSVEKAMQFEELEPRVGSGTYCVFTDATLVGKPQLPPNEFLHVTAGVKAWRGGYVAFKLFSNDTLSAEYRALLKLLRESVQELPPGPLR